MKIAFVPLFPTKNSLASEVFYMLRMIYQVPNDELFVNNLYAKISYKFRGKGLVTMC